MKKKASLRRNAQVAKGLALRKASSLKSHALLIEKQPAIEAKRWAHFLQEKKLVVALAVVLASVTVIALKKACPLELASVIKDLGHHDPKIQIQALKRLASQQIVFDEKNSPKELAQKLLGILNESSVSAAPSVS
jgi:hypothetical protein